MLKRNILAQFDTIEKNTSLRKSNRKFELLTAETTTPLPFEHSGEQDF